MVRDGARLAYTVRRGDASKRVALIHSLALDRSIWDEVVERLAAEGAEVLTYDARGHGASDRPPGPYSVELFADDLADLLDVVGWSSTVVAGASMGGCVALAFAVRYPSRSKGLGLIDTTAWYGPQAPAQWEERARKALTDGFSSLADFQITRWFSDGFRARHPEIAQRYVASFSSNDVEAYAAACRMLGACDLREGARTIRVPTAIVVGEEDYATPIAMSEALHDAIPGSSLTILKGARHLTPIEAPDRVAAEVGRLLRAVTVP